MAEILKELYQNNEIDDFNLEIAVNKRWINEDEKSIIVGSKDT